MKKIWFWTIFWRERLPMRRPIKVTWLQIPNSHQIERYQRLSGSYGFLIPLITRLEEGGDSQHWILKCQMKNHQKYWICSVPGVHHNKSSFPISGAFWLPERLTRVQNITQGVTYFWWRLMVADSGCQKDDVMSKNTPRGVSPRSKAQESCQCNPSQFSFHSKKFFSETKGFFLQPPIMFLHKKVTEEGAPAPMHI